MQRLFALLRTFAGAPESTEERDTELSSDDSDSFGTSSSASSVHMGYVSSPWGQIRSEEQRIKAIRILLGRRGLPPELISAVISAGGEGRTLTATRVHNQAFGADANAVYLRTLPLRSRLARHFILRIDIYIESHDQGWSSDPNFDWRGTTQGSWTWWDVTLERPTSDGDEEIHRIEVQRNLHAVSQFQTFHIQLGPECPIVQDALPGDRLVLYARTMFVGWVNFARQAQICVTTDWDS